MNQEQIIKIFLILKQNEAEITNLNNQKMLLESSARSSKKLAYYYMEKYRRSRQNKNGQLIRQVWASANSYISRNRKVWWHITFGSFWEKEVPTFSDRQFKERFRMHRVTFDFICDHVGCYIKKKDTNWRKAIPVPKRIAVALYALGSSAEYATIGHLFGIGRTTVGQITLQVCEAINKLQNKFIYGYPPTDEQIKENIRGFNDTWGFPQCYAAIDGCHIEVSPWTEEATDYHNYKGWYSTVLFAAMDYRYRFIYISVGSPGRNNDAFIYGNSKLKTIHTTDLKFKKYTKILNNVEVPVLLIGDSAFPLSHHLMKPFPYNSAQNEIESNFNKVLSRSRRVVENAFGHLKGRFRRIGKGLEVAITNTNTVIRACCIIHNICNESNDKLNDNWLSDDDGKEQPSSMSIIGEKSTSATNLRLSLAEYLVTNRYP